MVFVMRSWLVLGALAMLISGCAWFSDDDVLRPAELVDFKPTVKLEKLWSESPGSGQDARYTRFVPAFSEDRIFVADHKGRVFALDQKTGDEIWQHKTELPISGAVGAGAGMVLLGTYNGEILALSQDDGQELWRAKASSEILAPPQANGEVVIAQTIDGRVFAYDADSGERRWSYDHPLPVLTLRSTARPLLTDSQLFVGFDNGQLVCFNPDNGVVQWEVRVGQPQGVSDLDRVVDVDSSPLLVEAIVYSASYQGSVVAVSRGTGRVIWRKEASTYRDLAHGNNKLYVAMDDSRLLAYGATSGDIFWQNEQMLRRGLKGPAAIDGYVAVMDDEGYMHLLSQADGSFAQRLKPPGDGFRAPLMSVNNVLYVLSDDGTLTAYQVAND